MHNLATWVGSLITLSMGNALSCWSLNVIVLCTTGGHAVFKVLKTIIVLCSVHPIYSMNDFFNLGLSKRKKLNVLRIFKYFITDIL